MLSFMFRFVDAFDMIVGGGGGRTKTAKNFIQIHTDPAIYMIRNFLSASELDYFDVMCTHYGPKFKASFTDTDNDVEVISEERTSKFIHLSKSQDKYVRGIEQRAADLVGITASQQRCDIRQYFLLFILCMYVGLSSTNVEPLQIVSYGPGQHFTVHHDAGTLLEDGSVPNMITPRRLVTFFLVFLC